MLARAEVKKQQKPAKDAAIELLKQRYEALKSSPERANCEATWQEIAEVMSPRKLDFIGMRTGGEKRMAKVLDPTGIHANELLAAGLHGMATNPASKWFSLRMVAQRIRSSQGEKKDINQADPVQIYLSDVEEVMWQRIYQPGSNFTTALHEFYLDLGAFGTAILYIGQTDYGGLLFESQALSSIVFAENSDGRVDTVFRKISFTVRQIVQLSRSEGWAVPDYVRDMFVDGKMDEPIEIIHAVYPRSERDPRKRDRANMKFASCYFDPKECMPLFTGGYPEFPFLIGRWSKYASELYGRGPGHTALPDVNMLQAMVMTTLKVAQKVADPQTWLRDDAVSSPIRGFPGGVSYVRGNPHESVMVMPTDGRGLSVTLEMLQDLRSRILRTFFSDVLQLHTDAQMTATEVMQRTSERMRLLGPLMGRLESEVLGPMVERIFGILSRLNLLPEPPEEVQGQDFTVEYVSPIATAQKQQAVNGVLQAMQVLQPLGPEIGAQVISQRIDPNKLLSWAWDLFNCNPDLLKGQEEIEEAQEQSKAAMQLQQAGMPAGKLVEQGSKAAANLAKAGVDVPSLLKHFTDQVQRRPRAQGEAMAIADQMTGGNAQAIADEAEAPQ